MYTKFFLSKRPPIPLYYFTKMLMILQEAAHVWQIKLLQILDVKGAPSTVCIAVVHLPKPFAVIQKSRT